MTIVKKDPLTVIYNLSFTTVSFPHQMFWHQIAKITPIFKAGDFANSKILKNCWERLSNSKQHIIRLSV